MMNIGTSSRDVVSKTVVVEILKKHLPMDGANKSADDIGSFAK